MLIKPSEKKVVGMVGDGVNDVLALKDADCGIAMAAGSDAAKQSAHIVLLDSDFACLRNIVSEGRTIIANIERVSALYLTKTLYSILLCVIFILLGRAYPFIPVQLSLISAACIGFPSFVLTLEHTEEVTSTGFLRLCDADGTSWAGDYDGCHPACGPGFVTVLEEKQKCLPIPLISWSEEQSGSWSYFVCAGR